MNDYWLCNYKNRIQITKIRHSIEFSIDQKNWSIFELAKAIFEIRMYYSLHRINLKAWTTLKWRLHQAKSYELFKKNRWNYFFYEFFLPNKIVLKGQDLQWSVVTQRISFTSHLWTSNSLFQDRISPWNHRSWNHVFWGMKCTTLICGK